MAEPRTQTINENNRNLMLVSDLGFTHPDGKDFSFWTPDRVGSGERYYDGQEVFINAPMTLYAQWGKGCKVTWNAMGGKAVSPSIVEVDRAVGTLPTTTKAEYNFIGWYTAATGGTQVTKNTIVSENVTYYARWSGKSYVITDPNWLRYDDGYSNDMELFSKRGAGKYRLEIKQMNIIHDGHHSSHRVYVGFFVANSKNSTDYTWLSTSSSNTTFTNPSSPLGVHFSQNSYTKNGKQLKVYQIYVTGCSDGGGSGYFTCTTTLNLPYASNNLYISLFPRQTSDQDNCEGRLTFNNPKENKRATITLTKID